MSATTPPQGQQDRTAQRTCAFCGDRDPMYHGVASINWGVYDGLDRCPDCAWMGETVPLDPQREAARTDPRGIGDGCGR